MNKYSKRTTQIGFIKSEIQSWSSVFKEVDLTSCFCLCAVRLMKNNFNIEIDTISIFVQETDHEIIQ